MLTEYKGEPAGCQHHGLHSSFPTCHLRALYQYDGPDGTILLCTPHAAKIRDHFQNRADADYSEVTRFAPPPAQTVVLDPLVVDTATDVEEEEPVIQAQDSTAFAGGESGGGGGGADFGDSDDSVVPGSSAAESENLSASADSAGSNDSSPSSEVSDSGSTDGN